MLEKIGKRFLCLHKFWWNFNQTNKQTGFGNIQLIFGTANGDDVPTERMRITNDGVQTPVGIQSGFMSYDHK